MAEIHMPKMGDGMEAGTINAWLKKEGDLVKEGESIADVETDKANVEIAAYETGILTKIIVQVGQTVPVGDVIGVIGEPSQATNGKAAAPPASGPATETASKSIGNGSSITVNAASQAVTEERVKSSPLARKVAQELGIDIATITGSGPGGRIVERDVTAQSQQRTEPAKGITISPTPDTQHPTPTELKPSRMREAIAKRTVLSKQNIPHFYVTMLIEMDRALALLKDLNTDTTDGKITVNDILIKGCAVALGKVPEVNATWTPEGTIRRYAEAHIGVAVGIDEGLIIPVVRDCQSKTLRQISVDAKALIGKARKNQLKPEEYTGGTFSISNLGMMGVDEFIAIINPPEAAILAIGGISRDPVVTEDDTIVIRSRMKVTISADHRLLDGVVAARFLQEVKRALESPFSLLA